MKNFRALGFAAIAATAGFSANAAVVTIDEFSTSQTAFIGANGDADNVGVAGADLIGGVREVTLSNTDGADAPFDTIFIASNGVARFESGAGGTGSGILSSYRIDYDGAADSAFNPAGLGSVDLVNGTNTSFMLRSNFVDGTSNIQIQVWDSNGTALSSILAVSMPGTYFIPFADFVGIDFSDISAISVLIDSVTPAADLNLDYIRATEIPVPGASILFGTALLGLAAARRRRTR